MESRNNYGEAFDRQLPQNDNDAVKTIVKINNENYRYNRQEKNWYVWNGIQWKKDPLNTAGLEMLDSFIEAYKKAYFELSDEAQKKNNYLSKVQNASTKRSLLIEIQARLGMPEDFFNEDINWFVFEDGQVLNLKSPTFQLMPATPRPLYRVAPVTIEQSKIDQPLTGGLWQETLDSWLHDRSQQRFLQEAAGAALLGRSSVKKVIVLHGESNTGKSTYLKTMQKVFGAYGAEIPASAITKRSGFNFEQDLAKNVRFLWLDEPGDEKTDDSFFLKISGGGDMQTAPKGQQATTWKSQAVFHIAANNIPRFNTANAGIISRIVPVEFKHVLAPSDEGFTDALEDVLFDQAREEIMLWVLAGAQRVVDQQSILVPDSLRLGANEMVADGSAATRWFTEEIQNNYYVTGVTTAAMTDWIPVTEAYDRYLKWCHDNGENKYSSKRDFKKYIDEYLRVPSDYRGLTKKRTADGNARIFRTIGGGSVTTPADRNMSVTVPFSASEMSWTDRTRAAYRQ